MKNWREAMGSLTITLCLIAPSSGWAQPVCQQVAQTDFVGQLCTAPNQETRTGRWLLIGGGTLEGNASAVTSGSTSQVTKAGTLTTPMFQGRMDLQAEYEYSPTGQVSGFGSIERLMGKETLQDGGIFDGTIVTGMFSNGMNKSTQIDKSGTLTSPIFRGNLTRKEDIQQSGSTVTSSYTETMSGTWILAPGMKFAGSVTISGNNGVVRVTSDTRKRVFE